MPKIPKGIYPRTDKKGYYTKVRLNELNSKGEYKLYSVYGSTVAEVQAKAKEVEAAVANGTFTKKRERKQKRVEEELAEEAKRLADRQQAEMAEKLRTLDADNMSFGAWYERWLNQYKIRTLKDYTISSYKGYLRNYLRAEHDSSKPDSDKVNRIAAYHLGAFKLKDISGMLLQDFYNTCLEIGLQPKTLHNIAGAFSECLSKAVVLGLIPINPALSVELPKIEKKKREVLNREEIRMFLMLMHNSHDPRENVVGVMLCIGLRVSEVMGISWDNVSFENHTVTICQQLQRRKSKEDSDEVYTLVPSTKNGKIRTIYAPDICFEYLKAEKEKQEKWQEELEECWSNKYNLCFTNCDGSNISQSSIWRCVKQYAAAIGKPNLRVHDLRHSFATLITANPNIPIVTASGILGHSTPSFTLNTYVHDRDADKKEAQREISDEFNKIIHQE